MTLVVALLALSYGSPAMFFPWWVWVLAVLSIFRVTFREGGGK